MADNGQSKAASLDKTLNSPQNGGDRNAKRPRRPNYAHIHRNPLPILTYPLPAFIPHNPLSLVPILGSILSHYLWPPAETVLVSNGYLSLNTRSVHITDQRDIRRLWEMGFFGKGNLSRSEPTWLDQEKRRLGLSKALTSEEITARRREERQKGKMERARIAREALEQQQQGMELNPEHAPGNPMLRVFNIPEDGEEEEQVKPDVYVKSEEHLQLSFEEALFLVYALGALNIYCQPQDAKGEAALISSPHSTPKLLTTFRGYFCFPPLQPSDLEPDDPFLLRYVVYHKFRSLGWIVRDGVKFAVDYLLYERGLVFQHARFAISIIPSYSHPYWKDRKKSNRKTQPHKNGKDWVWLHAVNRVQTQVFKHLVIAYVEVPPKELWPKKEDIGKIFQSYSVREICVTRFSPNRNRD